MVVGVIDLVNHQMKKKAKLISRFFILSFAASLLVASEAGSIRISVAPSRAI